MVAPDPNYVSEVHPLYKELVPPSAVTDCVEGRITGSNDINLVLAKGDLLQIYMVYREAVENSDGKIEQVSRLSLFHECRVFGIIRSMGTIYKDRSGAQYLLLAFNDAKLSVLEWDSSLGSLETVSLHYYEIEELKKYSEITERHSTALRVDPQNRCAILWYYGTHLAILHFDKTNLDEKSLNSKEVFEQNRSRSIALKDIHSSIYHVLDIVFLNGYIEPTVAILFEPKQTWTGRLAHHRDSCAVVVVSLSMTLTNRTAQTYPVIFHAQNLPYNCESLVACPSATGGVLITSPNALIYLDYTNTPGLAVAVNAFYGVEAYYSHSEQSATGENLLYQQARVHDYKHLKLSLEQSQVVFVDPDTALIVLKSGDLCLFKLYPSTDESVGSGWSRRKPGAIKFLLERLPIRLSSPSTCRSCVRFLYDSFRDQRVLAGTSSFGSVESERCIRFFIGSSQANSQLVEFIWSDLEDGVKPAQVDEVKNEDDAWEMDEDDKLLYGNHASEVLMERGTLQQDGSGKLRNFKIRVTDEVFSSGSLRCITVGQPVYNAPDDNEKQFDRDNDLQDQNQELEIVACSGEEETGVGNLLLFQKSLRFNIDSSFNLESGAKQIWTFKLRGSEFDSFDNLCVINTEQRTLVFETSGQELNQVDYGDFMVEQPTVETGLLNAKTAIQICPYSVIVIDLENRIRLKTFSLKQLLEYGRKSQLNFKAAKIVSAQLFEQTFAILFDGGLLVVFKLDSETLHLEPIYKEKSVRCFSLFSSGDLDPRSFRSTSGEPKGDVDMDMGNLFDSGNVDEGPDEEELFLYSKGIDNHAGSQSVGVYDIPVLKGAQSCETEDNCLYLGILFSDSSLKITKVSVDPLRVFQSKPIVSECPFTIADSSSPNADLWQRDVDIDMVGIGPDVIEELLFVGLGRNQSCKALYMVLRTAKDKIVVYRCSVYSVDHSCSFLLFTRQNLTDSTTSVVDSPENGTDEANQLGEGQQLKRGNYTKKLKTFSKLGDPYIPYVRVNGASKFPTLPRTYEGVFVSGKHPRVLLLAVNLPTFSLKDSLRTENYFYERVATDERFCAPSVLKNVGHEYLRMHNCPSDGPIACFSAFHTPFCPFGFIYLSAHKKLRIARLPGHFDYTLNRPVCKRTFENKLFERIAYHHTSGTYVAVSTRNSPFVLATARYQAAVNAHTVEKGDAEPDKLEEVEKMDEQNVFMPLGAAYVLELISPRELESISEVSFDENEVVSSMACVSLTSKASVSGYDFFVAVGTSTMRGEDLSCRGKVYLYSVINIVPDPDRPFASCRLKQLASKEEKGPITALCDISGYLVTAVGQKVIISEFGNTEKIEGVAFMDIGLYTVSMSAVKGLLVVADVQNSVQFLGFQDEPPRLKLLGHDYQPLSCYSVQFLIQGSALLILVSDFFGNVTLLEYAPQDIDSELGKRLMKRSEFHVGPSITSMVRLVTRPPCGSSDKREGHFVLGCTTWGSVIAVVPLPAKSHSRLVLLTSRLVANLRPLAGLNPAGYRIVPLTRTQIARKLSRISIKPAVLAKSGVSQQMAQSIAIRLHRSSFTLDGDLLFTFLNLPKALQEELAKNVGADVETILLDLSMVDCSVNYF